MTQIAAYDAGLTDDPGCWIQKIDLLDPRLNPDSPEYDPGYAAEAAWEEPSPAEQLTMDQARQAEPEPQAGPEHDPWLEPEHDPWLEPEF
jgi:hypothetical protein